MATKHEKLQKLTRLYKHLTEYSNVTGTKYLGTDVATAGFKPAAKTGEEGYMDHVPWEDGDSLKVEKRLQEYIEKGATGLQPVHAGPMSKHYYQWDVETKRVKDPSGSGGYAKGDDRLWIYDDQEVWSTNFASSYTYYYVDKKDLDMSQFESSYGPLVASDTTRDWPMIVITNRGYKPNWGELSDDDLKNIVGFVERAYFYVNYHYLAMDIDRRPEWMKYTQSVLDWTGFVPIIGDFLDAVNAAGYLLYDMYWDAALSAIAVIPVVGSSIRATLKGAKQVLFNPVRKAIKIAKKTGDWTVLIRELEKSKVLTPKQLEQLESGLLAAIPRFREAAKRTADFLDPEIAKKIDKLADAWESSLRTFKLGKGVGASAFKSAKSVIDGMNAAKNASIWTRFIPKFRFIRKPLARSSFWPENQLVRIANILSNKFAKQMINNVDKLTALIKFTSPSAVSKHIREINEALTKNRSLIGLPANVRLTIPTRGAKATQIKTALTRLKSSLPKQEYNQLASKLVKIGQDEGSLVWNAYKTSNVNNLSAYVSLKQLGYLNTSLGRWVDIMSNEFQNLVGDIKGMPEEQQEKAVIWPVLQNIVATTMPGPANTIASIKDNPLVQGAVSRTSAVVNYAADAAGLAGSADYEIREL